MENLAQLFERFSAAYRNSLYAIETEKQKIRKTCADSREQARIRFAQDKDRFAATAVKDVTANMRRAGEAFKQLAEQEDTIIKAAEYLAYGSITPQEMNKVLSSADPLPWVMPFLGQKNIYAESNGDACQRLGLQFLIHTLLQTAPGQLHVTVINPELRPEFAACSPLPDLKVLTKASEIGPALTQLTEEIVQNDTLLQGRYPSLLALRRAARQSVGRLRIMVIQDLPREMNDDSLDDLIKVARGGPRAGISLLFLNSKSNKKTEAAAEILKKINTFFVFSQAGDSWHSQDAYFDKLNFIFPVMAPDELADNVSDIAERAKTGSVITVPFSEIEDENKLWSESSVKNMTFALGKMGLNTVTVCLGDRVTQLHNILISGAAGQGKSNLLEVMIHSLCARYSPSELALYLLDFKDGLTFKPYGSFADQTWLPHARVLGIESDRDVGLAVLKDLEAERRRRANLFGDANAGVHDFESYRRAFPNEQLPRIILMIDEYQKLFDIQDEIAEESASLLENLVRQGRACSIHVILASQTITGAPGLLGKEDKIYPQFPVRIGLKNTVAESFTLFMPGNDAAAKLRVRGEAVMNQSYGAPDYNQKFTVAYAEPDEMKKLRNVFCSKYAGAERPVIFSKKDTVDFTMFKPDLKRWRRAVNDGSAIRIPCGMKLSINKTILSVSMANDTGRNVAILGSAEDLQADKSVPGKNNTAIGLLQSFALSLALQHPDGNARFVMIDGLAPDVRRNGNMERWLRLMERFGFPVEVIGAREAAQWLIEFRDEIAFGSDENTYILGFGMDRCSNFEECGLTGDSGASVFQELLKKGTDGVHFLCWWSNAKLYQAHIGFSGDGYIGTKILLRMDNDTAREILGPFVKWSVRNNRAYIHDSSDLPADETVIPALPMTDRVCGATEGEACW